ncbi:hypothetical protein F2Q69_00057774 [Brassica cretica]|uniref:peroxidase n=1 Tax=Brassica cretica TaxID=69181 RepID=A0A8S9N271_BRACR|nr:hypothetical protein F2Q69_00057774 [Brassica cretica]
MKFFTSKMASLTFFVGCDASVLLDAYETQSSDKEASPNLSLRGLDVIAIIKSKLEDICLGAIKCRDESAEMKLFTSKMASLAFFVVILSIYIVEIDKGTKGNGSASKGAMQLFNSRGCDADEGIVVVFLLRRPYHDLNE